MEKDQTQHSNGNPDDSINADEVKKGRNIAILVIGIPLIISIFIVLFSLFAGSFLYKDFIPLGILLCLGYYTYFGYNLARVLSGAIWLLSGVLSLGLFYVGFTGNSSGWQLSFALGMLSFWIAFTYFKSKNIMAFQKYKRMNRIYINEERKKNIEKELYGDK